MQSYATPVGEWGLWLALIALVCVIAYALVSRVRMRRRAQLEQSDGPSAVLNHSEGAAVASTAGLWALYTLLTLAPMTGLLDSRCTASPVRFSSCRAIRYNGFCWPAS